LSDLSALLVYLGFFFLLDDGDFPFAAIFDDFVALDLGVDHVHLELAWRNHGGVKALDFPAHAQVEVGHIGTHGSHVHGDHLRVLGPLGQFGWLDPRETGEDATTQRLGLRFDLLGRLFAALGAKVGRDAVDTQPPASRKAPMLIAIYSPLL
jgi:hypothetical protein